MSTYTEFLNKRTQESIHSNDIECINQINKNDKELILRIENHRKEKMTEEERETYTTECILNRMKDDPLLRSLFRKDPTRQTIHEKTQIEWIRINKYNDVQKLNADNGGICMANHKLCNITGKRSSTSTKSFDIHVPSKNIYGILKHTNCAGGAQDNQYRDVIHFVQEIVGYLSENASATEQFEFYLDGKYYTTEKINKLEEMIPTKLKNKITITSCESINP